MEKLKFRLKMEKRKEKKKKKREKKRERDAALWPDQVKMRRVVSSWGLALG